jgi:opacity protein-like surface antigen
MDKGPGNSVNEEFGMRRILATAALIAATVIGSAASAATISQFNRTVNDGVFSLTQAQASYFGFADADYIGFVRPRQGNGVTWTAGDTFDAATMWATVTGGASRILAFLNGTNATLGYTGDTYGLLGTTTLEGTDTYRGVAFLFSEGAGNITFRGTSTFNMGQSLGTLDFQPPSVVPVPAALPLLLAGLGGLAFIARRRKAA